MKTFNLIAISAIASSLLAACGGSSNSGNNSSQPQPPVITKYDRAIPAAGDNYTFKVTLQSADGSSPKVFYRTEEYSAFAYSPLTGYEEQTRTINISAPYLAEPLESLTKDGSITTRMNNNDLTHRIISGTFPYYDPAGYRCIYSLPATPSTSPYYVGQSWDSTTPGTCYIGNGTLEKIDVLYRRKGNIAAQETVTVPAGNFTTLKEVFTNSDIQLSSGSEIVFKISDRTCWRDIKTGLYIRCQITTTDPYYDTVPWSSVIKQPTVSILEELIGFSIKTGDSLPVPQRFTGNWNIYFNGEFFDLHVLDVRPISIDTDGNISMTLGFQPTNTENAVFQGKIDNAGNLKMTGSSYDGKTTYTVTGVASGTNSVSGTIVSSTGASQAWQMTR